MTVPSDPPADVTSSAFKTWAQNVSDTVQALDGATYPELITEAEVSGAAASIDLTSIPATYDHLRLVASVRSNPAGVTDSLRLNVNGDTGANYYRERILAFGSTVVGSESLAQTVLLLGQIAADTAAANGYSSVVLDIPRYAATDRIKVMVSNIATPGDLTTGTIRYSSVTGVWNSTAAINQLTLTGNGGAFVAGSSVSLYGWKGA